MPFHYKSHQFELLPATFVFGFDTGMPGTLRPSPEPDPVSWRGLGQRLQAELCRVGWDIPGIDVTAEIVESLNGKRFRFVSDISGVYRREPFQLLFGCNAGDASDGVALNDLVSFTHGKHEGEWGFADNERPNKATTKLVYNIVQDQLTRLAAMPSAAGHDRLSGEGDDNMAALCRREPSRIAR